MTPSFGPVCPNHGCPLDGIGFPMPQKGTGICQISGWPFDFEIEIDEQTLTKDAYGNMTKATRWAVNGDEK